MILKPILIISLVASSSVYFYYQQSHSNAQQKPWMNKNDTPEERAKVLLSLMTLEEKVAMLHGYGFEKLYVGTVKGNIRLDIPPIYMNDGPQGFRDEYRPSTTTAFPSG